MNTEQERCDLREKAQEIRRLFCIDKKALIYTGGPPYTEDIYRELYNTELWNKELLTIDKKRVRLGWEVLDGHSKLIGYLGLRIVTDALPTKHEREYVKAHSELIKGIFIRKLIVHPDKQRQGVASLLIDETQRLANDLKYRVLMDITTDNFPMRRVAHVSGAQPSIFWYTAKNRLMVRYMW